MIKIYNLLKNTSLILASSFIFTFYSFAGNRSGIVAEQFLKIPTDARIVGMGSAMVAIAEGVSSMTYNPSGIMSINGIGFTATHTPWFADIKH